MADLPDDYTKLDDAGSGMLQVTNGAGNEVWVQHGLDPRPIHVVFHGVGNRLVLDAGCQLHGSVLFLGSRGKASFRRSGILNVQAAIYDDGTLNWGPDCTAFGVRVWVHGGRTMTIGAGCLFSENIQIRTSDHHAIVDLGTGEVINKAADVTLGDRVWVSEGVRIGKGVKINSGSIIAGSAYVTREVPSAELWAGVPAKKLRGGVSWTPEYAPSDAAIANVRHLYAGAAAQDRFDTAPTRPAWPMLESLWLRARTPMTAGMTATVVAMMAMASTVMALRG